MKEALPACNRCEERGRKRNSTPHGPEKKGLKKRGPGHVVSWDDEAGKVLFSKGKRRAVPERG